MQVYMKNWGNRSAIRRPAYLRNAARFKTDQLVEIRKKSGGLMIENVAKPSYVLSDLLGNITNENLHPEIEFGPSAGREAQHT